MNINATGIPATTGQIEYGRAVPRRAEVESPAAHTSEEFVRSSAGEPEKGIADMLKAARSESIGAARSVNAMDSGKIAESALSTAIESSAAMLTPAEGTAIRILFTDDLHGSVFPKSGYNNPDFKEGGFSMLSTLIKEKREETPSLLLDAGDWAQGTFVGGNDKGSTVISLMNELGYDAAAIGNHEFDWGTDNLKKLISEASFDVLAANLKSTEGGNLEGTLPHVIKEVNGVKVGLIGVTTETTPFETSAGNTEGVEFLNAAASVRRSIPQLKKEGAELVVLISHCGTEADMMLAKETQGIDLIVSGHDHGYLKKPIHIGKTMIVEAGAHTSNLGMIDLNYNKQTGEITSYKHDLTPINSDTSRPDPAMEKKLAEVSAKLDVIMGREIGETSVLLSKKGPTAESVAGNLVTDAMREATGSDVAFINTGGMKKSISPGVITFGNIYELLPYENELVTVKMTGDELRAVLEDSASHAEEIQSFGNRRSLQCSGIRTKVNPSRPVGERCFDITVNGEPIDPKKTYSVTTIDYLVKGSNEFPSLHGGTGAKSEGTMLRDAFVDYVKSHGPFDESNTGIEGRQTYIMPLESDPAEP